MWRVMGSTWLSARWGAPAYLGGRAGASLGSGLQLPPGTLKPPQPQCTFLCSPEGTRVTQRPWV